jgi:hypothetical protein
MMRKPSEHHAGHNDQEEAEDDIACVVRLVRPVRMSGAVVTRDTDADQHERREHDRHTTEDQQPAVVVHVGSLGPGPARSMTMSLVYPLVFWPLGVESALVAPALMLSDTGQPRMGDLGETPPGPESNTVGPICCSSVVKAPKSVVRPL